MKTVISFLSSLRLTVAILFAAIVLVCAGTLAQVHLGLWETQRRFFQSYLVWWGEGAGLSVPIWPGGYLLGWLLLLNLLFAYGRRFKKLFAIRSIGLVLIHLGLLLLLLGQFASEHLQIESAMRLEMGESRTYSESIGRTELAIIESKGADEVVTAIPERILAKNRQIRHASIPFTIGLDEWQANSAPRIVQSSIIFASAPRTHKTDEANMPSARLTIRGHDGREQRFIVSTFLTEPGAATSLAQWARENGLPAPTRALVRCEGREFTIQLRFARHYKYFGGAKACKITLLEFTHERYPGTSIDKSFSSRIRLSNPNTGEEREALISMNTPLRYGGETFYQGGFDPRHENVSILQVVRNPVWFSPYISCAMIGLGLLTHFLFRLARTVPIREKPEPVRPDWKVWSIVGLIGAFAVLELIPSRIDSPFELSRFGELPVLANGRRQPLDSLARNSLLTISGRSTVPRTEGRLTAIEWLVEVMSRPDIADNLKVFRLENLELRSRLNAREGRLGFVSLNDIRPELTGLQEEAAQIENERETNRRTGYQRDLLHLFESLLSYQRLKNSLQEGPYAEFANAYRSGDAIAFNKQLDDCRSWFASHDRKIQLERTTREAYFNRAEFFYKATLLYVASLLVAFIYWLRPQESIRQIAQGTMGTALALHTVGLIFRMALYGRPPVTNLYSSAVFIGWVAAVVGLVLERRQRNTIGIVVGGLIGFVTQIIAHHLADSGDTMPVLQAVLDTNVWLATHVVMMTTGYTAMFVAGTLAIVALLRRKFDSSFSAAHLASVTNTVFGVLCFATLFTFVGTVLGGIWADQSWGRFWGWDPKENGALLIVLWCALLLHARLSGWIRERGLIIGALIGNIITSFSWFGVNLLGVGLHTYGFMEGAFRWLAIFIVTQVLCIIWAGASLRQIRARRDDISILSTGLDKPTAARPDAPMSGQRI